METSDARERRRLELLHDLAEVEGTLGLNSGRGRRRYDVLDDDLVVRPGRRHTRAPDAVRAVSKRAVSRSDGPPVRLLSPSRSHLIRFGQFDQPTSGRLRAFHLRRTGVTSKLHQQSEGERGGLRRELRARAEIDQIYPELAPALLSHGTTRSGVDYLVEPIEHGTHPADGAAITHAAPVVLRALAELHLRERPQLRPASQAWRPDLVDRFDTIAAKVPLLLEVSGRVRELLERDAGVAVGIVHGDLVGSNILLRDDGQVRLVDWEFGRRGPIVADLGKLLQQADDQSAVLGAMTDHLGAVLPTGGEAYPLRDQLALMQVAVISWHRAKRARAKRAGRLPAYRRDMRRRTSLLRWLLGVEH